MDRRDLSATSWITSRLTALVLAAFGVLFLFRPSWLGWDALTARLGGETGVVAAGLGIAFFVLASLSFEKNQMRVQQAETAEALHQLLYGRDHSKHREAIGILVNAMRSADPAARRAAHENLVRLTGQNFAEDADVWAAWWRTNEKAWSRRGPDAGA